MIEVRLFWRQQAYGIYPLFVVLVFQRELALGRSVEVRFQWGGLLPIILAKKERSD